MKYLLVLYIVLMAGAAPLLAQAVDSTSVDSVEVKKEKLRVVKKDSIRRNNLREKSQPKRIVPWKEEVPIGSEIVSTDSLLRWQIWPNWGDHQAYRRDVISFRQGTNGRIDAYHIKGFEPLEQEIRMEGIQINNPVTGLPNYNLIPHRKISSVTERYGGSYHSNIKLQDYYILKPVSYLNYDEADGTFRNLEFMVTQNFSQATNLEVSYWDRRGGDYYPNSQIKGSQVVGRVYHHLSDELLLRGMYLRNQFTNEEPFGYNVGDPSLFAFDEFISQPRSSNGSSDLTRWDMTGGIYHRKDTSSVEDAGWEISTSKNVFELTSTPDTIAWDLRSFSTRAFKQIEYNSFEAKGELSGQYHSAKDHSVLSKKSWIDLNARASLAYKVSSKLQFFSMVTGKKRDDGEQGYEITAGGKVDLIDKIKIRTEVSGFSKMPTIQAKYWEARNYQGNASLRNETGLSASAGIDLKLGHSFMLGVSGRWKNSTDATFLSSDSTFKNSSDLTHLFGTAYARFENHRFEIESAGTIQQYRYLDDASLLAALNHQDLILRLKNSAFIKGYVFDRAAYLKIGVKTLLSPFYFASRTFNTELQYWQGNSTYQEIPPFFRLDGELSARVRGIMVVIRWENALDGLGQSGYFEAAGFPMPPRRLMVGIRAQFRN